MAVDDWKSELVAYDQQQSAPQDWKSELGGFDKQFVETLRSADAADADNERRKPLLVEPMKPRFGTGITDIDAVKDQMSPNGESLILKPNPDPPQPPSRMDQWIRGAARLPQAPPQFEHLTPAEKDQFAGWAGAYNDADRLTDHNLNQIQMMQDERSLAAGYPKEHRDKLLAAISDVASEKKDKNQFSYPGRAVAEASKSVGELPEEISDVTGLQGTRGEPLGLDDQRFVNQIREARENKDPLSPYEWYDPRGIGLQVLGQSSKLVTAIASGPAGALAFTPGMYRAGRQQGYSPLTAGISAAGQTALFGGALRALLPAAGAAQSVEQDFAQTFLQRAGQIGKQAVVGSAKGTGMMTLAEAYNQSVQAVADKISGQQGEEVGKRVQRVLEAAKSGAGMSLLLSAAHTAPEFYKAVADRAKGGMIAKDDMPESNRAERKAMYDSLVKSQPQETLNVPQDKTPQSEAKPPEVAGQVEPSRQGQTALQAAPPREPEKVEPPVESGGVSSPQIAAPPSREGDSDVISIKNRVVESLRTGRGEEALPDAEHKGWEESLDEAAKTMQDDPDYAPNLVDELKRKPRAHTDKEVAAMTIRYQQLNEQFTRSAQKQIDARESGNQQALDEATASTNRAAEALDDVERAGKASGTESGRGLAARRMQKLRDGSMANIKLQRTAARGGKKLPPEQEAAENEQIAALSKEINDIGAKYDAHIAESADKDMHAKIDAQIATDKVAKAEGKRESLENRSIRLVDRARDAGVEPDQLRDAAKGRADEINEANAGHNAAYRDALHKTGMTPEQVTATDDWTGIKGFDVIADQLATDYPEYFAGKHGDTGDPESVWAMMKEGVKKDVRWHDVLDDVTPETNPDADVPFSLSPKDESELKSAKPQPRSKREVTRKAIDDAKKDFSEIRKKNKGFTLGSTKIVPDVLLEPEQLSAAVKLVKAYIDHGVATLAEVWADLKKSLGTTDEDYPFLYAAWRQEREAGNVPSPIDDPKNFEQVSRLARKVQRAVVDAGITDRDEVVKRVQDELKAVIPDISERDTKMALSRYGKFRELAKDDTSVKIREINGELQQLLKLEDMEQKRAPLKTGFEQRDPSDEERQLRKQVYENMKKGGYVVRNKNNAQKSILESKKTALRNQITDLQKEIDDREKIVKTKNDPLVDKELLDLRKQLDAKQKEHDEVFNRAAELESKRLADYKKNLTKRLAELDKANDNKQALVKNPINKTVVDSEAMDLKNKLETAWNKQRDIVSKIRYANRPWWEKVMDAVGGARVAGVLSHASIIGKLTASAVTQIGTKFVQDVGVGSILKKLPFAKDIMKRASEGGATEGIVDVAAHAKGAKAAGAAALSYARDIVKAVMTLKLPPGRIGEAEKLDTTFGKNRRPTGPIETALRNFHAVLHDPVKIAGFNTDFEKRMSSYARTYGDDYVKDPINQLKIADESYKNAQKWIFFQDNELSSRMTSFFRARIDSKTGKPTPLGKAGEVVGKVAIPITKIPLNIIGEAFETIGASFTLPVHATRIGLRALKEGSFKAAVESLTPEQADLIARHMKRGLAGAAFMALGYFNPASVGGFYSVGYKNGDDEAEWGTVKVGGMTIPRWMLHNPLFLAMHFGATVRHIQDSYLKAHDVDTRGLPAGILAGSVGIIEGAPGVQEMFHSGELQRDPEAWVGKEAKSIVMPGIVQDVANQFSTSAKPKKPIKPTRHKSYN